MELYDARVLNRKRSMKVLKGSSGCKRSCGYTREWVFKGVGVKNRITKTRYIICPNYICPNYICHNYICTNYNRPMLLLPDTTFARHLLNSLKKIEFLIPELFYKIIRLLDDALMLQFFYKTFIESLQIPIYIQTVNSITLKDT